MKLMPLKKLSATSIARAITEYQSGDSLQQIGDRLNVSRQSMWDLLRRRIPLRSKIRFGKENHFYRNSKASDWAQNKVERAIKTGFLIRPKTCSKCKQTKIFKDGRSGIQAHHCDYNKPLEVLWLCQKCHHAWHKFNEPIRRVNGPS